MTKLIIAPTADDYSAGRGEETISVDYGGGATGIRRAVPGAPAMVAVRWVVGAALFNYLLAFYRYVTRHGSLPFEVDLTIDSSALEELTARIVPGSFEFAGRRGSAYVVQAQLEVVLARPDALSDAEIVAAYEP